MKCHTVAKYSENRWMEKKPLWVKDNFSVSVCLDEHLLVSVLTRTDEMVRVLVLK